MTTCAIRYRLNGPGPSAFLVECADGMRMYTRGRLGERMQDGYVRSLLMSGPSRWVPATGELILEADIDISIAADSYRRMERHPLSRTSAPDLSSQGAASA